VRGSCDCFEHSLLRPSCFSFSFFRAFPFIFFVPFFTFLPAIPRNYSLEIRLFPLPFCWIFFFGFLFSFLCQSFPPMWGFPPHQEFHSGERSRDGLSPSFFPPFPRPPWASPRVIFLLRHSGPGHFFFHLLLFFCKLQDFPPENTFLIFPHMNDFFFFF